jgi:MerR family transcriptional regulator, heat shock protein HspR
MARQQNSEYFTISVVSSMFNIHPQTLRLYEREGLLQPDRSAGNTRLYSRQDIEHLSTILNLTREMGVNLAGVSIIMDLLQKLKETQAEKDALQTLCAHMESHQASLHAGNANPSFRS